MQEEVRQEMQPLPHFVYFCIGVVRGGERVENRGMWGARVQTQGFREWRR